jgi:sentrin-specific protease 1
MTLVKKLDIVKRSLARARIHQKPAFSCLREECWLNDLVIDGYMSNLERESNIGPKPAKLFCFSSHFWTKLSSGDKCEYNYSAVSRWTRRKQVSMWTSNWVIIPVLVRKSHWCLVVVDMRSRKIQYLDSLGGYDSQVVEFVCRYMADEHEDKFGDCCEQFTDGGPAEGLDLQTNGYDCGIYICLYATAVLNGADWSSVKGSDCNMMRLSLALALEL